VENAVEARALVQRYGRRHVVFDGLDLTMGSGVTGLLGPNGAGKSTLLETISTSRAPAGGRLTVLGQDVGSETGRKFVRQRLGYLPQHFGYVPTFTVSEFVSYAAWLKRVDRRRAQVLVDEALGVVGLQERATAQLKTLSGGMLRRVGIAQAIVHRPRLLILDEPTAGLDPQQRIDLRKLLRTLAASTDILISTHLVEDVRSTCDTLLVLQSGRVAFSGSPQQLAEAEAPQAAGDNDLERGYSSVLTGAGA